MTLVFIHGMAASGKLTIARELAELTGMPVFHNHLVVDAVLSVFDFGTEPFIKLRHEMWMAMFREAVRLDRSLIFTFTPERSVPAGFVPELAVIQSGPIRQYRVLGDGGSFAAELCQNVQGDSTKNAALPNPKKLND